jgi:hypothetical protein
LPLAPSPPEEGVHAQTTKRTLCAASQTRKQGSDLQKEPKERAPLLQKVLKEGAFIYEALEE